MKNLLLVSLFLLSFQVYADGSSGCGLGWSIASKNSLLSSSIRNTTHAILPNTFSMTSGTSGCAKHSIVKNEYKGIHYAEGNFHQLMAEMSQGRGEVLNGFAAVLDYHGDMNLFGEFVQKNYSRIFTSASIAPVEMYNNFKHELLNSKEYVTM